MTTEQKARAYDKAIEKAQDVFHTSEVIKITDLFPQLAESEDERIRKTLIHIVKGACDKYGIKYKGDITQEQMLAYLEQQKAVSEYGKALYYYDGKNFHFAGNPVMEETQIEPHYTKRNALFDKCVENCDPEVMKKVSDEVDEMLEKEQKPIPANSVGLKEQKQVDYEAELKKCKDNPLYFYDKYVSIKQKSEWSETDERILKGIIGKIDHDQTYGVSKAEMLSFLKSLRPQHGKDDNGKDDND